MPGQKQSRKHPTCSRCRSHGKRDVRVLQHQCPFKSCPCQSCRLIKRRSVIYRAQRNLDKRESSFEHLSQSSTGSTSAPDSQEITQNQTNRSTTASNMPLTNDPRKYYFPSASTNYPITDFESFCLTFSSIPPSYLQSTLEQCENDFQRAAAWLLNYQEHCTEPLDLNSRKRQDDSPPVPTELQPPHDSISPSGGEYVAPVEYEEMSPRNDQDPHHFEYHGRVIQSNQWTTAESTNPEVYNGSNNCINTNVPYYDNRWNSNNGVDGQNPLNWSSAYVCSVMENREQYHCE